MKQQTLETVKRERERESGLLENEEEKKGHKKWLLLLLLLLLLCFIAVFTTIGIMNKNKAKKSDLSTEVLGVQEVTEKIKISPSTTEWTNENVIIKVEYPTEGYTNEISIDGGKTFIEYTGEIEIEENTEIIVRMVRNGEVVSENKISITNIDKIAPEVKIEKKEIKANSVTIKVEALDNASGLSSRAVYKYYIKKGNGEYELIETTENKEYTFTGLEDNTDYTIKVEVEDLAGNIGSNILQIRTEKSTGLQIDPNGGTYNGIKGIQESPVAISSIEQLADPVRTGYTFNKWEVVEGNLTKGKVKAKWNANTYTIEYDGNGATSGNTKESNHIYDEVKALTTNGYKKEYTVTFDGVHDVALVGYTFAGWSTSADGKTEYSNAQTIKNVTEKNGDTIKLYAIWEKESVKLPNIQKAGQKIEGWYRDESLTNKVGNVGEEYTPEENVTLYPKYETVEITLTFDANGGNVNPTSITSKYGDNITLPVPTRVHTVTFDLSGGEFVEAQTNAQEVTYTFNGWYTAKEGGEKKEYTENPGIDQTLYAHWEATSITLPTPTKTENKFLGWYTAPNGGELIPTTFTPASDITIYAKWEINKYTLTLDVKGGTPVSAKTHDYGTQIDLPTPTKEGYTFKGWYTDSACTDANKITGTKYTIESNATIYAGWDINEYTITFDANEGNLTQSTITAYYNENITLPTPTREYTVTFEPNGGTSVGINDCAPKTATYTFDGWYTEANGGEKITLTNMPAKDQTVYAHWTKAGVTLLELTKTGYEFKGWYEGIGFAKEITGTTYIPEADITIYAKWEANKYTVTLHTNGGTINNGNITEYTYGIEATLPTDVTKTGYTFKGWYEDTTFAGTAVTAITATETGDKEYYAKWEANTYTVTLHTNGGTINSGNITEYTYGEGATLPTNVTREGYTFGGWYTNESLTGSAVTTIKGTEAENKDYYAKWEENGYTVTLHENGGTIAEGKGVISYVYGNVKALPSEADITKEGHTFKGWYENATFAGTAVTAISATETGDKEYYAKWEANKYTVTLHTNDGTINNGDITEYTYGTGATLPTDVTNEGYTFKGWYENATFAGTAVTAISATETGDKEYYAKWEANTYTVTLNTNAGTINNGNITEYTYGEGATLPTDVEKEGYTFEGWYTDSTYTGTEVTAIGITETGNKEYYAKWRANTYTIVYNGAGKTAGTMTNSEHEYNDAKALTENEYERKYTITYVNDEGTEISTKEVAYEFKGWSTEEGATEAEYADKEGVNILTEDGTTINLYAVWESKSTQLPSASKEGYTFTGWYEGTTPVGTTGEDYTPTKDVTLKATFGVNTITLTLNANGGEFAGTNTIQKDYGETIGAELEALKPTKEYIVTYNLNGGTIVGVDIDQPATETVTYTFGGWYKEAGCTTAFTNTTMPSEDATIYAKWVETDKSVTLKTPSREGYTFKGWYTTSTFTGEAVTDVTPTENMNVYAKWEESTYTVTLNTNGGTINSGDITEYTYGTGATLPTDVEKEGHTFKGWYADSTYTGTAVTSITATETGDKEYWAKWEANTYTVTLHTNDGTINNGDIAEYTYGIGATLPTDVTKTGYTFKGWYEDSTYTGTAVTAISATETEDKEYYAKWEANTYTVTLHANDGTIAEGKDVTEYTYGTGATLPTDITKEGHTFKGWYVDSTYTGTAVTSITATETGDKEYYAKWEANTYTVTLHINDGTIAEGKDVTEYTYGAGATLPTDITKEGHTFKGWYADSTYTGTAVTSITATETGDKEYYAKWEANTYTVTLHTNDGIIAEGKDVTEYTYGIGATLPTEEDIEREGYTFAGWYTTATFTGDTVTEIGTDETEDKEYYAKWEVNTYTVTLHANDGIIAEGKDVTEYTYGIGATLPTEEDIEREGYTFAGWYVDSECSGTAVTAISTTETEDKEYYAKWEIITYTITYVLNDGELEEGIDNPTTVEYGEGATLPEPTKEGYNFVGWYTEATLTEESKVEETTITPTEDITLYAKWENACIYGQPVNYSVDVNGTTLSDWRVFYQDEDNTYLIAGDYVPYSTLPESSSDATVQGRKPVKGNTDYKAYWNDDLLASYTGSAWIKGNARANEIATDWLKWVNSYSSSTDNNIKAVAYMMDTKAWSSFADATYADYAIGGPTIELFCASYKDSHPSKYIECDVSSADSNGYKVRWNDGSYTTSVSGLATNGEFNKIYIDSDSSKAYGYWLASPSASNDNSLLRTGYNGFVAYDYYNYTGYGFRPLVSLKSNIQLVPDGNGSYNLVSVLDAEAEYDSGNSKITVTVTKNDYDIAKIIDDATGADIKNEDGLTATKTGITTHGIYTFTVEDVKGHKVKVGVTTHMYGAQVSNYSANGIDDWRVFYQDSNNTYLIAGDYVPYSKLPKTSSESTSSGKALNAVSGYPYRAQFTNVLGSYSGSAWITGNTRANEIATDWLKWVDLNDTNRASTNNNIKAVAYMLDTTAWSVFKDTRYGDNVDYVIGGPTIEMYCASYNETHEDAYKLYCDLTNSSSYNEYGYKVKKGNGSYGSSVSGLPTNDFNKIYNDSDYTKATGYWLASPSASNSTYLLGAYCNGIVDISSYSHTSYGFRPLVSLNSNVQLVHNGDGTYRLQQ